MIASQYCDNVVRRPSAGSSRNVYHRSPSTPRLRCSNGPAGPTTGVPRTWRSVASSSRGSSSSPNRSASARSPRRRSRASISSPQSRAPQSSANCTPSKTRAAGTSRSGRSSRPRSSGSTSPTSAVVRSRSSCTAQVTCSDMRSLGKGARLPGSGGNAGCEFREKMAVRLDAFGVSRKDYAFDMGVVRGLDYYTGMVFEIDSPNLGAEKQVGGGGAYNLAEVFGGEPIAQTGFALGLDRLVMSPDAEKKIEPPRPLDAYGVPIGEGAPRKANEGLSSPRAAGP